MAEQEKTIVTGLETASNRKEAEYDLVKSLLSAMDYQNDDLNITEVEIKRKGVYLFTVRIHPISDEQVRFARKKAKTYMPNPNNKKLPPIEKDMDDTKMKSWVIYLATVEEDQNAIWGAPEVKAKAGVLENWETIGHILTFGEKNALFDKVLEISGIGEDFDDEQQNQEEYSKN